MCGISLCEGFELPGSLLHHPMVVKKKKKKVLLIIKADRTVRVQRRRGKPLETQVHIPPKATSCQSTQRGNYSILYISSDSETSILTVLHQWTREVQTVLKSFAGSYKQEPALAYSKTICYNIHLWHAESCQTHPEKNSDFLSLISLLCWLQLLVEKGNS